MRPIFHSDLRRYTVNLPPVCPKCGYDITMPPAGAPQHPLPWLSEAVGATPSNCGGGGLTPHPVVVSSQAVRGAFALKKRNLGSLAGEIPRGFLLSAA